MNTSNDEHFLLLSDVLVINNNNNYYYYCTLFQEKTNVKKMWLRKSFPFDLHDLHFDLHLSVKNIIVTAYEQ